jgi:hypothetical protein
MNYLPYMTLVGWETRNWRHRERALVWCKDYGLAPLTKHVFWGELYAKERREMEEKFKGLFIGKTEKFFFATMCRACFNEGVTGLPIRKIVSGTDRFELVQMSENP